MRSTMKGTRSYIGPQVGMCLSNRLQHINSAWSKSHSLLLASFLYMCTNETSIVCGEVDTLRTVLAAGADISTRDINGGSPLHYAAQMCGGNTDGKSGPVTSAVSLEILNIILLHPKSDVNVVDKDKRQPLLWAASAGSAKALVALIKAGAKVESADK